MHILGINILGTQLPFTVISLIILPFTLCSIKMSSFYFSLIRIITIVPILTITRSVSVAVFLIAQRLSRRTSTAVLPIEIVLLICIQVRTLQAFVVVVSLHKLVRA
uniref:Uncharacterized protein n=1 Tax=Cacopsylla melanoneura TaxID=428564 RepID=A0A8D9E7B5_9HEMI